MKKYYIISIDSLVKTFSVVEAGRVFGFKAQIQDVNHEYERFQIGDNILVIIDESVTYNLIVNSVENEQIRLIKNYEIAKAVDYSVEKKECFYPLSEDEYQTISNTLFSDYIFKKDDKQQVTADISESFKTDKFIKTIISSKLLFSDQLINRFIASLFTKPFVILTGLSGSGKTKLAQAFARWICDSKEQYCLVPVGADWTNREPLLGYPSGLDDKIYVMPDTGVLQLLINAQKPGNENKPFFLILDEMNLSHIERYFADFLSIMESKDTIKLYSGKKRKPCKKNNNSEMNPDPDLNDSADIETEIKWPESRNLFIIGTVNIDETTYMFSPKVLDRANVIEFRVDEKKIKEFLQNPGNVDMSQLSDNGKGHGSAMAQSFLEMARLKNEPDTTMNDTLIGFFNELEKIGAEFGYRTAYEISRLIYMLKKLTTENELIDEKPITADDFIDIAIMQKLLPKLHGSRSRLISVLTALGKLCLDKKVLENIDDKDFQEKYFDEKYDEKSDVDILYKISFAKIKRMYRNAIANGYASYAEN